MNARTPDGVVHALRTAEADGDKCHRVLCGLKGQQHAHALPEVQGVEAKWTNEKVTCMQCLALQDQQVPQALPLAPMSWPVKKNEEPS